MVASYKALKVLLHSVFTPVVFANSTVWDYAPDYSKDPYPPYPDLQDENGNNLTVESLRGTHLFGWKGCTSDEANQITQAYNDFYTLSNQLEVYNNIAWDSPAAKDFWGPASGPNQIPDNTRKEIQQIFQAAQQVYSYPWTWQPPWLSWRQLWIEIRCSDSKTGKDSSDPDNKCGDAKPDDGNCPGGSPPVGGGAATLQAFSDPNPDDSRYSRITFCNDFFKLNTFSDAINNGKRLPAAQKKDLSRWDNRARCFFHEVTHLDYFMNAGDDDKSKSPYVSDLEVYYTDRAKDDWHDAYGPYNCRVLRNWVDPDPQYSGYFTQRNADNYAFFALAKYVEKQINDYPSSPSPGRRKPKKEPRDAQTHEEPQSEDTQGLDTDLIDGDEQDPPDDITYPGCGDKFGTEVPAASISASISSQYASGTGTTPTATGTSTTSTTPTTTGTSLPKPTCSSDKNPSFSQPDAENHIKDFCGDKDFWDKVLVPPVSFGTGATDDGRGKALGVSSNYTLSGTSDLLWLGMMFTNDSCTGMSQFTVGTNDDEKLAHCTDRFDAVLNGCQTGTTTAKTGGELKDVCIIYSIMRRKNDEDPYADMFKDDGDFVCEKTDVSSIGGDSSPLKNTCTCHYSNYPGLFDTFKMPSSGDCKDTSKADLLNN